MRSKTFFAIFLAMFLLYGFHAAVKANEYRTTPVGFPDYSVTGERDGYLFIAPINFGECSRDNYLMILDGDGELVYYKRLPDCQFVTDFKPQPDGTLSYWTGYQLIPGVFYGELVRLNSAYEPISIITETNLLLDGHEYLVLPNGDQLVMYGKVVAAQWQASTIPAVPARMIEIILRKLDKENRVLWEWNSADHISIEDADDHYLTDELSDYMHTNAMDVDQDGNLLISSRHLNEITKIDMESGEILWRMGGKENEFALTNDERWFSHQHDIRRLSNGNISLFDNGNFKTPAYSRYVEYAIDENKLVMTKTFEIRHTPDVYGMAMGSGRRLANGHVLIGWGANSMPAVTEYDYQKGISFELNLQPGEFTYRAYSGEWAGQPANPPFLEFVDGDLVYGWNGSTEVLGYYLYGGDQQPAKLISVQAKAGFETITEAPTDMCVFRAVAFNRKGEIVGQSPLAYRPECRIFFPIAATRED